MSCSLFALPGSVRTLKSCEQIWRSPPRHGPARQVKGDAEGEHLKTNQIIITVMIKENTHSIKGRLQAFWLETGETLIWPTPRLLSTRWIVASILELASMWRLQS